jgi:DNA-binding GntR family transcriptional regulator
MLQQQLAPLAPRRDNLATMVFEAIRDSIVNATIAPGSQVSEAWIASQLHVSKTPVREALLRLRHIGLVEPTPRGLRVIRPSVKAIRDAYELRAGIEGVAGRYAANRATTEEHEHILFLARSTLERAEAHDGKGFRRCDREFHQAIADAAHNDILRQSIEDSHILTSVLRERDFEPSGDSVACAQEHIDVAMTIQAGNPEAASNSLTNHIHHVMSLVLGARSASANLLDVNREDIRTVVRLDEEGPDAEDTLR